MSFNLLSRRCEVILPYSEAAMHHGIAGMNGIAFEEDLYINGRPIPVEERIGCYVTVAGEVPIHMLKSEAGWKEDKSMMAPELPGRGE